MVFKILINPHKEFSDLNKRTFETVVSDYIWMLVYVAIAAGSFNFLYSFFKATYLDFFLNTDIQYFRMINYSLGRSISLIFFYIFVGTFILFFISISIKTFFSEIKYMHLLAILIYSLSPLLIFSWLPFSPFALLIWSVFLFYIGIKLHKTDTKIGSIHQRD